jgi:maltooligosyltrehalose trehalohydrolase
MLFMGEEYGEPHPFLYFVDHDNPELVQAVHEGRKREFENLHLQGDPPFVGDKTTFLQSQLQWDLPFTALPGLPLDTNPYQQRWRLYQHLIQLRRRIVPSRREQMTVRCHDHEGRLQLHYDTEAEALLFFNVQAQGQTWDPQAWETLPQSCGSPGIWYKVFDSTDPQWSHTPWMGKPTAPDTLDLTQTQGKGDQITLQGYHAAVYQRLLTERKSYQ